MSISSPKILVGNCVDHLDNYLSTLKPTSITILVDTNTEIFCLPIINKCRYAHLFNVHTYILPAGEKHKTLSSVSDVWNFMIENKVDRKGLIINLGGGVISDLGGFTAACYKRGIQFINIPTTLLAQVDASIGGKTGIDFSNIKNSIGAFKNPIAVILDPIFLRTLPEREIKSGKAEMLKHGLIYDKQHWVDLKQVKSFDDPHAIKHLISRSQAIKLEIVKSDPYENGIREILNFGHSIGHAIESHFLHSKTPFLHGEAIAIGMIIEGIISKNKGFITNNSYKEIAQYLSIEYPIIKLSLQDKTAIKSLLSNDKKNKGGKNKMTLLNEIGRASPNQSVSFEEIEYALDEYSNSNFSIQS